jgi:hypothetical protein
MSSLTSKDRVSLCLFAFEDGRPCRTPRTGNHPHFCFYHAQKEARAQATDKLAKDLACFFSGDYLTANDLSTALSRLIPAVVRGDIKPRLARTVAYMLQTQLQAIHLSQHEYINAFGTDGWRKAIRTSVNVNYDYRFPPHQDAETPARFVAPTACHPERSEGSRLDPTPSTVGKTPLESAPAQPPEPASPQPAPPTTQPTPAVAAPSVARSLFRRRPNITSTNSFNTNIYTTPRNH